MSEKTKQLITHVMKSKKLVQFATVIVLLLLTTSVLAFLFLDEYSLPALGVSTIAAMIATFATVASSHTTDYREEEYAAKLFWRTLKRSQCNNNWQDLVNIPTKDLIRLPDPFYTACLDLQQAIKEKQTPQCSSIQKFEDVFRRRYKHIINE